jgi:hypothetical protein
MDKRTYRFLWVAATVLVLGLGTGLFASYLGHSAFAQGAAAGPDELAYVPADTRLIAFIDVREVLRSGLRQNVRTPLDSSPAGTTDPPAPRSGRFATRQAVLASRSALRRTDLARLAGARSAQAGASTVLRDFQTKTGIDIETDIDRVVASFPDRPADGPSEPSLMLARGRFDEIRIAGVIEDQGGEVEQYKGTRLLTHPGPGDRTSLAFLEPGLVAVGSTGLVRQAIDVKAGAPSVTGSTDLMMWVRDVSDGTMWAVGRFDSLAERARLPVGMAEQLPPITWFAASGRLDAGLHALIRAEARDQAAADSLRELLRGFLALARLHGNGKTDLTTLMNAVQIGGDGKTVSLAFSASPELLDALGALQPLF